MINVLLFTNDPIITAGFQIVIQGAEEFHLSVCGNLQHLSQAAAEHGARIVVLDVSSGITLETLNEIRTKIPRMALVLWLDNASVEFISQAIVAGASGVLRKGMEIEAYWECLRKVAAGELWLENGLSLKLLQVHNFHLTPRERQLVAMLAQGLSNKELAYRIGITPGTVKVYLSRLYRKVGVSDRLELVLHSLKNLGPDQSSGSESLHGTHLPITMPASLNLTTNGSYPHPGRAN
jgi:two-component system nitrate/nitrite response regulator NarL